MRALPNEQNANMKSVSVTACEPSILFVLINVEQPLNLRHFLFSDNIRPRQIEALVECCVVMVFVLTDDLPVFCVRDVINSKLLLPNFLRPFAATLTQFVLNFVWLAETVRNHPAAQKCRDNAS